MTKIITTFGPIENKKSLTVSKKSPLSNSKAFKDKVVNLSKRIRLSNPFDSFGLSAVQFEYPRWNDSTLGQARINVSKISKKKQLTNVIKNEQKERFVTFFWKFAPVN